MASSRPVAGPTGVVISVAQVMEVVKEVNEQGTTVLLVEQNARAALRAIPFS